MWLLAEDTARKMEAMWRSGLRPTAMQQDQFFASFGQAMGPQAGPSLPRNATIAGDTMQINVEGVLTKKPDLFAWFFGGCNCTYENILAALALAESDPTIKKIVWRIASPGGYVDGLFEVLAAIQASTKSMTVVSSMALSAAYAIAALAGKNGKLSASTAGSMFGCLGVVQSFCFDNDETRVDVTSTEAPNKRPDARTEEGKAVIVAELDAFHQLFVESIAVGRGTNVKTVNSTFGRGATLLARDAKKLGMIDRIESPAIRAVKPATEPDFSNDGDEDDGGPSAVYLPPESALSAPTKEPPAAPQAKPISSAGAEQQTKPKGVKMDLATLQAQHPELYKQIVDSAKATGASEAVTAERDRVNAHLEMGKTSGAMDVALGAIADGSAMTQTLTARYLSAGMNRSAQTARQEDSTAAGAALGDAGSGTPSAASKPQDMGDVLIAALDAEVSRIHK